MVVKALALDFRRGDGVAERARLEIACGSKAHRGFESPPLRVCQSRNFNTVAALFVP